MADNFEAVMEKSDIGSSGGMSNETKADLVDPLEDVSKEKNLRKNRKLPQEHWGKKL